MSIFRNRTENLDRGRTDFLNCYLTYFQWNEGLRCHFFPEKNSGENSKNSGEILLFIDEDIINSIGEKLVLIPTANLILNTLKIQ